VITDIVETTFVGAVIRQRALVNDRAGGLSCVWLGPASALDEAGAEGRGGDGVCGAFGDDLAVTNWTPGVDKIHG
jgi:hypothetical protein